MALYERAEERLVKTPLPQSMIRKALFLGIDLPVFIIELVVCSLALLFLSRAPLVSLIVLSTAMGLHLTLVVLQRKDHRFLEVLSRSTRYPAQARPAAEIGTLEEGRDPTFPYREIG